MQETINSTLTEYLELYRNERVALSGLLSLMQRSNTKNPTADTNFDGHVTGSIFVLTPDRRVLLLEHRRLGELFQPGGHIDPTDASPFEAALRELAEETGLTHSMTHLPVAPHNHQVPLHIEVQHITASQKYNEPAHSHYDFQYLTMVDGQSSVAIDVSESKRFEWVEWEEFNKMPLFSVQAPKIDTLLNNSASILAPEG